MKFRLVFDLDNDAFAETAWRGWELARILETVGDKLTTGHTSGVVMDANGNSVGMWEIKETK